MSFTLDPSYIGIPYRDRGRDAATGLDCWGLPMLFYAREKAIELPSLLDGYDTAENHRAVTALVVAQARGWRRVVLPEWADLVTLNVAGRPWHVGVVLDERHFLHTMEGLGSIIDRLDSPRWCSRVEGYWRFSSGRTP